MTSTSHPAVPSSRRARSTRGARGGLRTVLALLLFFLALNAFAGGVYGLSGARGVPVEWLEGSPFDTYVVPSLFLFVVIGGVCLAAAVALSMKARVARSLATSAGVLLIVWIVAQVTMVGFVSWLQPAVAAAGLLVALLAGRVPR